MPFRIPTFTSRLNGQRFLKGVGAVVSIVPPLRPREPLPTPMTTEQVIALSWRRAGADLEFALGQAEKLLGSDHAVR